MFLTVFTFASNRAEAATGDTHTQAVQKGLDFLVPDVTGFTDNNHCIACHRQGGALYGMSLAKGAGFNVSMDANTGAPHIAQAIVNDQQASGAWLDGSYPSTLKTSYTFYGLAGYDAYVSTAFSNHLVTAGDWALTRQETDGRWRLDEEIGITAHGDMTTTARIMVGIAQAMQRVDANKAATYKASLDAAVAYITAHKDDTSDVTGVGYVYELSWAIIGLKAAGLPDNDPTVVALVTQLQAAQSSLGYAWGQQAGNGPDAFNSGMAIYALCKAGVSAIGNTSLLKSLEWVNDQQDASGTWGNDTNTTFAILGLSCYGDYGVIVSNSGAVTTVLKSHQSSTQTTTYDFDIQNHGFIDDTYNLSVVGGMPGWTGTIPSPLVVPAGQHKTVTLTVTAPANLPEALPVAMAVVATSQTVPSLSSSARITTFTDPPPPTSGDSTAVTLTGGNGASVTLNQPITLKATVADTTTPGAVVGPGKGVVTFFVAGLAIATDSDDDGDGVYSVTFTPDCDWNALGPQDFRAIYSGIDLPAGQTDLLSSLSSGTITLVAPACCPRPETCDGKDNDCDGVIDNGFNIGDACSAGVGECAAAGTVQCTSLTTSACNAVAGAPTTETCDGKDNDCDGVVDNGFNVGGTCSNGIGACAAAGSIVCKGDGTATCNAVPGAPSKEICGDDVDSDCDGNKDNGCACVSDDACGSLGSGQICDVGAGHSFTCVLGCRGTNGNGCSGGLKCTSTDASVGKCVACIADADCGSSQSGLVCDTSSNTCVVGCRGNGGNACGNGLTCTSGDDSVGHCVGCVKDADCGDAKSGVVCEPNSNTCVSGCHADGNGCSGSFSCTASIGTLGTCVECLTDGDCGGLGSGRICDKNRCESGCHGTNGNGCGEGMTCSSTSDAAGTCTPVAGTTSSTTTATSSSSSGAGGAPCPTTTTTTTSSGEGGGLSGSSNPGGNGLLCSARPGNDASGAGWLVGIAFAAVVGARRRRRAAN